MRTEALAKELGGSHTEESSRLPCYDRWGWAITVLIYSLGKCDPRDLPSKNSQSRIVSLFCTSYIQWYHANILYTQDEAPANWPFVAWTDKITRGSCAVAHSDAS
jgi:hypothetical protein